MTAVESITANLVRFLDAASPEMESKIERLLNRYIIINKNDLPPVSVDLQGVIEADDVRALRGFKPAAYFAQARAYIAVALHLEANPPINEQQVGKAETLIEESIGNYFPHLARELVKAGVIFP